jgi:hypothetical protein
MASVFCLCPKRYLSSTCQVVRISSGHASRRANLAITELRNIVYEHFLDLEPSHIEAANLVAVHQQIHDEFAPLYLNTKDDKLLDFQDLDDFISAFFVTYSNTTLNHRMIYSIKIKFPEYEGAESLSTNLLQLVSVLRQFPLLTITWKESYAVELDLNSSISTLINSGSIRKLAAARLNLVTCNRDYRYCTCTDYNCPPVSGRHISVGLVLKVDSADLLNKDKLERYELTRKLLRDMGFSLPG